VVGAGVFGIFNAMNLQRLGASVVVVDQYGPGNSKATSGGETRGVRTSYGDRAHGHMWMDWADEAIRRWRALDEEWKEHLHAPLFYNTGDLIMRDETSPYIEQTRAWWDERGIPYEALDADEIRYRWPVINVETVNVALYEPRAGVVRARRACETVAKVFVNEGGTLRIEKADLGGRTNGILWDVELTPSGERLRAGQYVFALGPWFPKAMPELMGARMRVRTMGHTVYFGTPPGDNRFSWPNLPSYGVPGCTGWPALPPDNRGFRVRTGGRSHDDPDTSPRRLDAEDIERPRDILRQWFPDMLFAPVVETRSCHYEGSVSRNFIIDRHPDFGNVWITGGGSAEAFKQGPVLGEYLARRVLGLETDPAYDEAFRMPEEPEEDPGDLGLEDR
jgi:glycine/D-amino acid oxidase-like deaminating enzyme